MLSSAHLSTFGNAWHVYFTLKVLWNVQYGPSGLLLCTGCGLLQGGNILPFYNTDGEYLFRQEGFFHYLFGVNEDGFWGALDVRTVSIDAHLRYRRTCCSSLEGGLPVEHQPVEHQPDNCDASMVVDSACCAKLHTADPHHTMCHVPGDGGCTHVLVSAWRSPFPSKSKYMFTHPPSPGAWHMV